MKVLVVSSDAQRASTLATSLLSEVRRIATCSSPADHAAIAAGPDLMVVALPAAIDEAIEWCRVVRAQSGGESSVLVGLGPDRPADEVSRLVTAGLDIYQATPADGSLPPEVLAALGGQAAMVERLLRRVGTEPRDSFSVVGAGWAADHLVTDANYRTLIEQLPIASYIELCDDQATCLYMSPQVGAITGYAPEEWLAEPELWERTLHPADRERVMAEHLRTNAAGEPFSMEYRILHRDGRVVWLRDDAVWDVDANGTPHFHGTWQDITDRKEAEEALRQSEQRYRSLIDQTGGFICMLDGQGIIRSINPAAASSLGYRAAEMIGRRLTEFVPPAEVHRRLADQKRLATEPAIDGHGQVLTRDGHVRVWAHRTVRVDQPPDGMGSGPGYAMIIHAHDITEQYHAEQALRASEARNRDLLAAEQRRARELDLLQRVRAAVANEHDLSAVIRTVVDGLGKAFGYQMVTLYLLEQGRLILQHQIGYTHELPALTLDRGIVARVIRTGEPVLIPDCRLEPEFVAVSPEIVAELCVPLSLGGAVVGALNIETAELGSLGPDDLRLMTTLAHDVSTALGRTRLYEALRESEESFRTAFSAAPIGMLLLDTDRRPLRANQALARMLGHTEADLLTRLGEAWVHPADRDQMVAALTSIISTGGTVEREIRFLRHDGRSLWGQLSASLVTDRDGAPRFTILQIQDVTERKAMAEQLQEQALRDPMTGLWNRRLFLDRLSAALTGTWEDGDQGDLIWLAAATMGGRPARLASSKRSTGPLVAILYLDLDRFKHINDRYGHEAGDEVLQMVGQRLMSDVGPTDVVARWGGDEFTILMDGITNPAEAETLAARLLMILGQPFLMSGGDLAAIGASIGIAIAPRGSTDPASLLRRADEALYRAKDAGRHSIALAPTLSDEASYPA